MRSEQSDQNERKTREDAALKGRDGLMSLIRSLLPVTRHPQW